MNNSTLGPQQSI